MTLWHMKVKYTRGEGYGGGSFRQWRRQGHEGEEVGGSEESKVKNSRHHNNTAMPSSRLKTLCLFPPHPLPHHLIIGPKSILTTASLLSSITWPLDHARKALKVMASPRKIGITRSGNSHHEGSKPSQAQPTGINTHKTLTGNIS